MMNPYNYNQYRPTTYGDELKIVNGLQSAEQFMTAPNSRVLLMDSNIDRFYIKETDAAGISRIKAYDFKEVEEPPKPQYITMEQLEEVLSKYEFTSKQTKPTNEQSNSKPREIKF